ncbi:TIM barrel protein [Segetibacter sp.]|uniref:sugar phosphate isomerase/epimerase family protein n=1 Tax=Segetibacter sp. TaxID=2231182 RepID=UPI00261C747A|nr:TIM barrel protein [Segetibacter sp.]MCW3079202.1 xylose isomerase [Segetibacter sp.]
MTIPNTMEDDQKYSLPATTYSAPLLNRRNFLHKTSMGAAALMLPKLPAFRKETAMGIVVHSYGLRWNSKVESQKYPGFTNALDLMEHCNKIGAGGTQVVVSNWTNDFAKKVRSSQAKLGLYLEGSVGLPKNAADVPRFEQDVINAKDAGMQVLRTVCSSGRRYENYHSMEAFRQLQKSALLSLQLADPVLRKHKMKLGVENHKDWRAPELEQILKQVNSEWIGVTLDFGNSISLLEDPMNVIQTLAPYAFSTHVKDMALEEYADGFLLSEVPLGKGILDLPAIIAVCKKYNSDVTFSLEMITRDPLKIPCFKNEYWETFAEVPGSDLARTMRLVRQYKNNTPLPRISHLSSEEQLAAEEQNILDCLAYSRNTLGLK